jgi:hypothetical protein
MLMTILSLFLSLLVPSPRQSIANRVYDGDRGGLARVPEAAR